MTYLALSPALLLLFGQPLADKTNNSGLRVQYGTMSFRQRIIVRVPRLPDPPRAPRQAPAPPIEWKEKKAEKCVPITSIVGASVTRVESVDLITAAGRRLRARFDDDCPAIDFYAGFYLRRTPDGMVCAKRDAIRSRSGDFCRIEAFKELRPKR